MYGKLRYTLSSRLGKMVFRKVLEMSKTKIMRPSAYPIATITRRERIPATGAYDTVKSTTSSMDDLSAHVLGFK